MGQALQALSEDIHLLMVAENSLSTTLEHEGYKTIGVRSHLASTFSEVKKAMNKRHIDVILIDWEFKDLNAFEVIQYIRTHSHHKHIPIIVSSVHICDDRVGKLKEIDLFVKQPVPRVLLLERIRRLLDRKHRKDQRVALNEFYLGDVKVKVDKRVFSMVLADISMTGIFLYSENSLENGQSVQLEFSLPGADQLQVEGEVVRVSRMHKINDKMNKGIAVQFTKFKGKTEESLTSFLKENKPESNFMYYYL